MDLIYDQIKRYELPLACWSQGHDFTSLVLGVAFSFDQSTALKFGECCRDVAAVEVDAAAEICLTGSAQHFDRCQQAVVVATQAVAVLFEGSAEES